MAKASWGFLTSHAMVLTYISQRPDSTGRHIAEAIGLTERAVRKLLADLQAEGYVSSERVGRRNRYSVNSQRPIGGIGNRDATVGELVALLAG